MEDLVLKLREARRLAGLSQKEAAAKSGVGEKTISSFETEARIGSIKLSQLQRLLAAYGLTLSEFFCGKLDTFLEESAIVPLPEAERLSRDLRDIPPPQRELLTKRFSDMIAGARTGIH